mmetsp:Transcript_9358/g.24089  ORF Transcript_9358/g.24089 Transcript_9358/m.24089 type:complete len:141 (-) Transcript_9358:773-1195(-)|eukprot:CAMPEP_0182917354 /NCGR_PEP_ID=MMETSP0105_2-20130417/1475_1 /TAXON_ID=81532 ORGANISM="Acanthoeca-like sp., Strain 10tr" /NCGR_SAMPLE_ID=MMETSP0105_2 /ASSEMBLY_ACC=CAM_ASM_000205 /LENGTH=140 /DNA_ID=CAMNT_0025054357 /DNA_START=105 /DNA_END=527 /DNA_ORIENTATION=+
MCFLCAASIAGDEVQGGWKYGGLKAAPKQKTASAKPGSKTALQGGWKLGTFKNGKFSTGLGSTDAVYECDAVPIAEESGVADDGKPDPASPASTPVVAAQVGASASSTTAAAAAAAPPSAARSAGRAPKVQIDPEKCAQQ